jgi:hypothetical protein
VQDAVLRPDGALVTTGAIDRALDALAGEVRDFQVTQTTPSEVTIDVVPRGAGEAVLAQVREALAPLLGALRVDVRRATAIAAEPSGKFRIVRRTFPIDVARTFG